LVFVVTFLALILAVVAHSLIVLILLAAYNFIAQLVPGVLIGGLFWRRATRTGVLAGLAIGWGLTGYFLLAHIETLWGVNCGFVALIANIVVFALVSLVTKPVRADVLEVFLAAARDRREAPASANAEAAPLPAE
jgi:SSS family solute:Na+ symporter